MNRALPCVALAALLAAGCESEQQSQTPPHEPPAPTQHPIVERSTVLPLGDHYESSLGSLFVIGVQDEYRLIRCIPAGPIAGCYEDLFVVPREQVKFNRWLPVPKVPGLEIAIVSPTEVAYRVQESFGVPK